MGKKRSNRREKIEQLFTPAPPLEPKNTRQGYFMQALAQYPIVIATGYPGTGKTYIPARMAAAALKRGSVDRITLSRPNISQSQSLGYFKGTKEEKMMNWLMPIMGSLREELSPGQINYCIKEGVESISVCPLETIKGLSWKNSFVIVDEAEDCTLKELRSLTTRIGVNTTMVFCGDIGQSDLRTSGLSQLLQLLELDPDLRKYVAHVAFDDPDMIVRSATCKQLVVSFDEHYHMLK